MSVITLTTDWCKGDFYLPAIIGHFAKNVPNVHVIPICTSVEQHNIAQAAFLLQSSFFHFPDGTIHLVGVDYVRREEQKYIIVEYKKHIFIGADNGLLSLVFDEKETVDRIIEINTALYCHPKMNIFPELYIYSKVACEIINGKQLDELGEQKNEIVRKIDYIPTIQDDIIIGKIIYIDSFNNAITNISADLFQQIGQGREFAIFVKSKRDKISEISKSYFESDDGELIALFNSVKLLEIAMVNAKVTQLFNLDRNSTIRVNFYDK